MPIAIFDESYYRAWTTKRNETQAKGGFKSEDTEEFFFAKINIPNHYPEQKI